MLAALVGVLGFALVLPGPASPMHGWAADTITVSMSAPANVLVGNWIDYAITVTYTGELTGQTADYTFTDALPPQVRFHGLGISAGTCPTAPPTGQSGTVACSFKFAPLTKKITIQISVETTANGSVTNNGQLSSGETASATTSVDPPPAGSITASMMGPETIRLSSTAAPPRFNYTLALSYTGPPIYGDVSASFVERLPLQMSSPGVGIAPDAGLRDQCQGDSPPKRFGGTLSCNFYFTEEHRTRTVPLSVRPTGMSGDATAIVEVSNGATATWTTTVIAPPPEPLPLEPVAGPPAAPSTTVAETFTKAGTAESETVSISPTAKTVQVALTWPNSSSSFDVVGVTLTAAGRTLALSPAGSEKLRVTKKRGAKWLDVRIKGVHKGKLKFKIVARKVKGRTRVVAKIRQSKR